MLLFEDSTKNCGHVCDFMLNYLQLILSFITTPPPSARTHIFPCYLRLFVLIVIDFPFLLFITIERMSYDILFGKFYWDIRLWHNRWHNGSQLLEFLLISTPNLNTKRSIGQDLLCHILCSNSRLLFIYIPNWILYSYLRNIT